MQRLATQYLITASEAEKILVKFKTKRWIIEEDNSAVSLIVDHSEEQRAIDKIVAQKCESTDSKLIPLYIEALALRRADDGVRYKKISRDVSIRDRSLYALIVPGDICIDHFSQG
jgi:hypothetical protein